MTAADFRRIALSFDGAEEGSHMGSADFRVGGHIFATLASVEKGFGNLMLTPEIQAEFVADAPDVFPARRRRMGPNGRHAHPACESGSHHDDRRAAHRLEAPCRQEHRVTLEEARAARAHMIPGLP